MTALRSPPGSPVRRAAVVLAMAAFLIKACVDTGPGPAEQATEILAQSTDSGGAGTAPASVPTVSAPEADGNSSARVSAAASVSAGAGLEPARNISSDPHLAAGAAAPGQATARWGGGPNVTAKSPWRSIGGDGLHDKTSDAVGLLQEPRSAFRGLPRSISGDYVDWAAAIDHGLIQPRARAGGAGEMEVLDLDIVFADTKTMPVVTFPHRTHTEWLACGNCHDWLFQARAGSSDIAMADIARGRACGLCHGKVAFPATECFRCHNGPRPKG